jgi:hypothetical protein
MDDGVEDLNPLLRELGLMRVPRTDDALEDLNPLLRELGVLP